MVWRYTIRLNLATALMQALRDDRGEGGPTTSTQVEGLPQPTIIQRRPTQMSAGRLTAIRALPYVESAIEEQVP